MEGRLLFAPDPFLKQRWQGYKTGHCVIKGPFLSIKEKNGFLLPSSEEHSIPLEGCVVQVVPHPKKHLFEIVTSSGSKYNFISGSKLESDKWIEAVKESGLANSNRIDDMEIQTSTPWNSHRITSYSEDLARKANNNNNNNNNNNMNNNNNININNNASLVSYSLGRKKAKELSKPKKNSKFLDGIKRCGSHIFSPLVFVGNFGVPLQFCRPSLNHKHIPMLVEVCTDIIEKRGIDNQGLYRVPGNSTHVNSLCHELTISSEIKASGGGGDDDDEDERWADVNVVSSLLKLFFRKLPEPLITTSLYRPSIDAIRKTTDQDRVRELRNVFRNLPVHHFKTFKFLSEHLRRVSQRGDSNKMTANNISIVFGPTLICSREEHDVSSLIVDMPDQCKVVEACINNVEYLFSDPYTNDRAENSTSENLADKSLEDIVFDDSDKNVTFDIGARDDITPISKVPSTGLLESCRDYQTSALITKFSSTNYLDSQLGGTTKHLNIHSAPPSRGPSPVMDIHLSYSNDNSSEQLNKLKDTINQSLQLSDMILNKKTDNNAYNNNFQFDSKYNRTISENVVPLRYTTTFKAKNDFLNVSADGSESGDLTEQALQHLKRLSLDMRAFKHKHEMMKLEQQQRSISKERIEREYQKALNDLDTSYGKVHF